MAVLIAVITMSIEVLVDFEFKGAVEHPLRSSQAELVQSAPRVLAFPFGMDLDYILHRWRVLPLWPQGSRLIDSQTEEYAAFFKSSIHNIQSYLVRPRRRSLPYVEQPDADFFSQSAEMCRRSRTYMNNPG